MSQLQAVLIVAVTIFLGINSAVADGPMLDDAGGQICSGQPIWRDQPIFLGFDDNGMPVELSIHRPRLNAEDYAILTGIMPHTDNGLKQYYIFQPALSVLNSLRTVNFRWHGVEAQIFYCGDGFRLLLLNRVWP